MDSSIAPQSRKDLLLSVNGASGQDEIASFFDACGQIFDGSLEDRRENRRYAVTMTGAQLGPLVISKVLMTGGRFRYNRDHRLVASSGLDLVMVQIITEGGDLRVVAGSEIRSRPGDVFIHDLTRSARTMAGHCGNVSFVLPRAAFSMREGELDSLHDHVVPAGSPGSRLLHNHVATLWEERHRISEQEFGGIAAATAGLIGGLVRRSTGGLEGGGYAESRCVQICQFIETNLADSELGPATLAQRFSLSRAALYRLFASTDGVANYIRERRLRQAFRALVKGRQPRVSAVGFASGFSNTSSFIRAFRTRFGITPGEAMDYAGAGPLNTLADVNPGDGSVLRAWIELADRAGGSF